MTHTPGPWTVSETDTHVYLRGPCREYICQWDLRYVGGWKFTPTERASLQAERRATARLIACAPELLQALIHANEWSKQHEGDPGRYADLIAKATGINQPEKEEA